MQTVLFLIALVAQVCLLRLHSPVREWSDRQRGLTV